MQNPLGYFNSSPEVIRLAVMLYIRYPLSLRQVEDLLFERGIDICHETVRFWWNRFGPLLAAEIRKAARPSSIVFGLALALGRGVRPYQRRDTLPLARGGSRGEVLEVLATKRRDRRAALKFLKRTVKRYGKAKMIVTDRLRSYRSAMNVIGIAERQECGRRLNNRGENSHQPFRRRARAMARFRDIRPCRSSPSMKQRATHAEPTGLAAPVTMAILSATRCPEVSRCERAMN